MPFALSQCACSSGRPDASRSTLGLRRHHPRTRAAPVALPAAVAAVASASTAACAVPSTTASTAAAAATAAPLPLARRRPSPRRLWRPPPAHGGDRRVVLRTPRVKLAALPLAYLRG